VESVEVWWPDGPTETSLEVFPGVAVNQFLQLRRGAGAAANSEGAQR
jgi:hypothetical protein